MITELHAMLYTSDTDASRAFLRDKLGFSASDVGEGQLSFLFAFPVFAAMPGVFFLAAWWMSRRPVVLVASVVWLLYGVYETGMRLRWLCSGECNIRVDLVLIYPVLLFLSIAAIGALARGRAGKGA